MKKREVEKQVEKEVIEEVLKICDFNSTEKNIIRNNYETFMKFYSATRVYVMNILLR